MPELRKFRVVLKTEQEEIALKYNPKEIKNFSADWIFYRGVFGANLKIQKEGDPWIFVKDGAEFIRRHYDKSGISAKIKIIIEHLKDDWTYEPIFTGDLRFDSVAESTKDFFRCYVVGGGISATWNKNSATTYEIPTSKGMDIHFPEPMHLFETVSYPDIPQQGTLKSERFLVIMDVRPSASDIRTNGLSFASQRHERDTYKPMPFLKVTQKTGNTIEATMSGVFRHHVSSVGVDPMQHLKIVIVRDIGGDPGTETEWKSIPIPDGYFIDHDIFSFDLSFEIARDNFYQYYLYIDRVTESPDPTAFVIGNGSVGLSYFGDMTTTPFKAKAFKYEDFCNAVWHEFDPSINVEIPFLREMEQNGMQLFITSGDGVRGIEGGFIRANFKDLFLELDKLYCIGLRTFDSQNKIEFVPRREIFDRNKEIINFGIPRRLTIEGLDHDDWYFTSVKIGHERKEYNYPLGRQTFTSVLEFNTKAKALQKHLNLTTKYRTDYIGVRLFQHDYSLNEKKNKSDNDIFLVLAFWNNERWEAVPGPGVTVEGLQGGGYFNILLSPARCLTRHHEYTKAILDRLDKKLTFVSSDETMSNMVSHYNGDTVVEKADIIIPDTVIPLFKPLIFEIGCIAPDNLSEMLGESPSGYCSFEYNGYHLKGFPLEVKGETESSGQTIRLIAHPDTPENILQNIFKKRDDRIYP